MSFIEYGGCSLAEYKQDEPKKINASEAQIDTVYTLVAKLEKAEPKGREGFKVPVKVGGLALKEAIVEVNLFVLDSDLKQIGDVALSFIGAFAVRTDDDDKWFHYNDVSMDTAFLKEYDDGMGGLRLLLESQELSRA